MNHNDDLPGQLLLEYRNEIEGLASAYGELVLERNLLAQENEALRKNLEAQAKEIRILRDALDHSADCQGTWLV